MRMYANAPKSPISGEELRNCNGNGQEISAEEMMTGGAKESYTGDPEQEAEVPADQQPDGRTISRRRQGRHGREAPHQELLGRPC